jgi:hypothetical protein
MKSDIKTILIEPFIDLDYNKLEKDNKKVIYNQTFRQRSKYYFYQTAFDFLSSNKIKGDYLEFGCHKARTFSFALREAYIKKINMSFYAFDSFEGLPDHKNNAKQNVHFLPKLLSTSKKEFLSLISKLIKNRKVEIVKGFYEDVLNYKLLRKFKKENLQASFICIDCDLEKSVQKSLDFALNFIVDGTILYVDDYYATYKGDTRKGIPKVVKKILKKHKIFSEIYYPVVASCGKAFLLYR